MDFHPWSKQSSTTKNHASVRTTSEQKEARRRSPRHREAPSKPKAQRRDSQSRSRHKVHNELQITAESSSELKSSTTEKPSQIEAVCAQTVIIPPIQLRYHSPELSYAISMFRSAIGLAVHAHLRCPFHFIISKSHVCMLALITGDVWPWMFLCWNQSLLICVDAFCVFVLFYERNSWYFVVQSRSWRCVLCVMEFCFYEWRRRRLAAAVKKKIRVRMNSLWCAKLIYPLSILCARVSVIPPCAFIAGR